jgi:HD-like signal output (HDOD) protein
MNAPLLEGVDAWAAWLGSRELPVLARTLHEIEAAARDRDRVSAAHVAEVVLHDPLATVRLLRYIQQHRKARQVADITTISHALMMLGLEPFFRTFDGVASLERMLASRPRALAGAMCVMSRARHAALCAREWARKRHDLEVDEVVVAALLHEMAELMMWCFNHEKMLDINQLREVRVVSRSTTAQRAVLGFALLDLQLKLTERWDLPPLLHDLMDDHQSRKPRVLNVSLATAVARHCAYGWDDPALAHDWHAIGSLLDIPDEEARRVVLRMALAAARDWRWYGVAPAAALLPLTHEAPFDERGGSAAE